MKKNHTLDSDYFKKVYEANEDPWNFETSTYEADKYADTLNALPKEFYESAYEIGCSIGVLTKLLAKRCRHLIASDVSDVALKKAEERCKDLQNISFEKLSFPQELPKGKFDLIMVSEVAYYLDEIAWKSAVSKIYEMLSPEGNVVLVHWLPEVHDYPQTGDEVHNSFAKYMQGKLKKIFGKREETYRLDVWEKSLE